LVSVFAAFARFGFGGAGDGLGEGGTAALFTLCFFTGGVAAITLLCFFFFFFLQPTIVITIVHLLFYTTDVKSENIFSRENEI